MTATPGGEPSPDRLAAGLHCLEIDDFRNIEHARLAFSPAINLITGANAAGKTSLLEAIYCLGRVHSFRASDANRLVREGREGWRLVGRLGEAGGRPVTVGMERRQGRYRVHLGGQPLARLSELAGHLPVHLLSGETATIFSGGPRHRRQTLDWALFHVEHGYRAAWQRYVRVLRQRNAALRAQAAPGQVAAWDPELVTAAGQLDRLRARYLEELAPRLADELGVLLPGVDLELRYRRGWPGEQDLDETLAATRERDRARGYTHAGPQRADFQLYRGDRPAATVLSRGQQKATVLAFLLGQVRLQQAREVHPGCFLLDDLASELDTEHQARVLAALQSLGSQVFVTAIDSEPLQSQGWPVERRFHVEHGRVHEVV